MNFSLNFLDPSHYSIAITLLSRLLGILYILVYFPFLFQMKGLFGDNGILPIKKFLKFLYSHYGKKAYYYAPTLFWFNSSSLAQYLLIIAGIVIGGLLALGVYPALTLFSLYVIHLSLTSAGQDFLSFGWETLLMEITLALFLTVLSTPYNPFGWLALNFLLFRFHFQAGFSKLLSRDRSWRDLTAIYYHYFTQPLPNLQAWYFFQFPLWTHKISTIFMFYGEIIVPFGIFSIDKVRIFVFTQLVFLQFIIWFTGNFSYLNYMTVMLCIILLPNSLLMEYFDPTLIIEPSSEIIIGISYILGALFLAWQFFALINPYFKFSFLNQLIKITAPFHIAYPHGLFAIMTTKRYEIIIEGSLDGKNWLEYEFYFKPGNIFRRPTRIAPFQPRLDWQAWFLIFNSFETTTWFQAFLIRLLEGSLDVTKLLKVNPFKEKAPKYIRGLIYEYEFTNFKEKSKDGSWWKRNYIAEYTPMLFLKDKRNRGD